MGGEWSKTTLGGVALGKHGLVDGPFGSNLPASAYTLTGIPVIRGGNLSLGTTQFDDREFVYVSESTAERLARSLCKAGDIVFTKKGTIGQTGLVPRHALFGRFLLSSNQMRLRVDPEKADALFTYYVVSSAESRDKIRRDASVTGVPKTNVAYLRNFPISLPPLPEQRSIASILGALDDKIELNRQMNRTLEEMAQAIFKSWFIDFDGYDDLVESELGLIPRGWEVKPLQAVADLMIGGDWGSEFPSAGDVPVATLRGVDLDALRRFGRSEVPRRFVKKSSFEKRRSESTDVLVEGSGACGRSLAVSDSLRQVFDTPIMYSNFCKRFKTTSSSMAVYVQYVLNGMVASGEMQGYVTGTAMPNLDHRGLMKGCTVIVPPSPVLDSFARFTESIRKRLFSPESATLAALRDTLLPKLISGEIRVPEAEDIVEDAL